MTSERGQARRRALLAIPANNTTMERELNALCPDLAPFAVARIALPPEGVSHATLAAYTESTFAALEPFLPQRPELLVHGCTAAGFLVGREQSARTSDALRRRSGAVVVSTGEAMVDVLTREGVDETAVVTPYLEPVNEGLRDYLASAGIAVEVLSSFACATVDELGRIRDQQVLALALETVTPRSKALFIACSQLPTLEIIEPLREKLGIPVWSSIRATAWAAGQALATSERTAAHGS